MTQTFDHDICAVGHAIIDVLAECADERLETLGIAKGAMTLIEEDRAAFLRAQMGEVVEMPGGSAANTTAGIALLGGKPAFIGKAKDDALGDIFTRFMKEEGVTFQTSLAKEGPPTGQCLIFVSPDAQRSMNTYLGCAGDLGPEDIEPSLLAASRLTFLEGYLFDKPKAQEAFFKAARCAHEANRHVALSLSDVFCVNRHRQTFLTLARDEVDILLANEYELMALYGAASAQEAVAQARFDCPCVVCTRSEKGALIAVEDQLITIKAHSVEKPVDTTGAGDLFAAGFLYGLAHDYDPAKAGQLGVITAAEIITHYGARPQEDLAAFARRAGFVF
ncbi:MAG: adenosine kinase [Alphaproteobacteria bacterium]|nr:adenosine kinase [Alphaproteobacteria bacterium]